MPTYGRTRDDSLPDEQSLWYYTQNGAGPYGSSYYTTAVTKKYISDTNTPNYRKRIARGEIINNDCYMYSEELLARGGYDKQTRTSDGVVFENQGAVMAHHLANYYNTWSNLPALDADPLVKTAMSNAIASINNTPYGFAEDLGEVRETIQFLKNPAKSALEYSRKMLKEARKRDRQGKRYKKRSLRQKADDLSKFGEESYLMYRFAFSPLVRSMADATLALSSKLTQRPPRETARGFASDIVRDDGTHNGYWYSNTHYLTFSRKAYRVIEARAMILYTHSGTIDNFHKLGLRGIDLPETAWNLIPLSFMVDRVYNVSNVIRGVTNLLDPRLKILTASIVTKSTSDVQVSLDSVTHPGHTGGVSGNATRNVFEYNRVKWSPSMGDVRPAFTPEKLVQDITSIADLVALTGQNLRRLLS